MKLTITLPENISDITLGQYQRFLKLNQREGLSEFDYNKRVVEIFTELRFSQVDKISQKDYEEIIVQILEAFNKDEAFKDHFTVNDITFGFIPNFDKITTSEFVDIQKHGIEEENLHKLMTVLFRPIKEKDYLKNYSIEAYRGNDDYAEVMKLMPMNIVNGALGFFLSLAKELQNSIQRYTNRELMKAIKQQTTLASGVGMRPSLN